MTPAVPQQFAASSLQAMSMTAAMAERARLIEDGRLLVPDHDVFVTNLTDLLVGIVHAPTAVVV